MQFVESYSYSIVRVASLKTTPLEVELVEVRVTASTRVCPVPATKVNVLQSILVHAMINYYSDANVMSSRARLTVVPLEKPEGSLVEELAIDGPDTGVAQVGIDTVTIPVLD